MVEASMVLYRNRIISMSRGGPVSVEFDFEAVWAFKKKMTPNFFPDDLFWIHVHPQSVGVEPSYQDHICAESLELAFKEVAQFAIIIFNDEDLNNVLGLMAVYKFESKKFVRESVYSIGQGSAYDLHAHLLKAVSLSERIT